MLIAKKKREIHTEEWLLLTAFWAGVALFFFHPLLAVSSIGKVVRRLLKPLLFIHLLEGFLAGLLALKKGLSPLEWFWKGLYFGFFGWTKLL